MTTAFRFDCYQSVMGGWVASGTVEGVAGGSFEERPVWYGCQGDTWPELQAGMGSLVETLRPRVTLDAKRRALEALSDALESHK